VRQIFREETPKREAVTRQRRGENANPQAKALRMESAPAGGNATAPVRGDLRPRRAQEYNVPAMTTGVIGGILKESGMSDNPNREQDLVLSPRVANVAKAVGAATVGELARFTADELLSARCFGETSLKEIREALARHGLALGMSADQLRGRRGLHARIVSGRPKQQAVEPEHEGACCGDCEESSRKLRERTETERKLEMSLAELELSVRTTNCLESEGITTVRDLVIRSSEKLLEVRGFTAAMLREVETRLDARGLHLEMKPPTR
jgi:DNA-directed RNA polymerase alpha subunit